MTSSMTRRQAELLRFIESYLAAHQGVAPSLDEMRAGLGFNARSSVHRLLVRLEERGHIVRRRGARAIEIDRVTVAGLQASVDRLVAQEGLAVAVGALQAIVAELSGRLEGAT
jgi:SOS-response transcriptional repressor LexA